MDFKKDPLKMGVYKVRKSVCEMKFDNLDWFL